MCGNDRVWTVARDSGNQNQNDPRYFLVARELSTGKELYNSKNAKDGVKDWTMTGSPVSDETHLYIGAYKPNQPTEVHVLCLNAADGKLLWNTKVGAYKNDPRQQYSYSTNRTTIPSLLLAGGSLYIDTHAGSLVQMSPTTGEIAWGMNYDSEMPSTDRYYNQPPEQFTAGAPLMMNGALYFKGMRSRRLYAVDPAGPKVLWSRPVAVNAVLSGVDQERIYLGGPEISAYDLKTQQLLWSKHRAGRNQLDSSADDRGPHFSVHAARHLRNRQAKWRHCAAVPRRRHGFARRQFVANSQSPRGHFQPCDHRLPD